MIMLISSLSEIMGWFMEVLFLKDVGNPLIKPSSSWEVQMCLKSYESYISEIFTD